MSKSPDAFRTISEVAAFLDTPTHVLRFWESKFPQIKPVKRAGGRRYYRPDDIALLSGIKVLLHEQGMTIRGVQKLLKERGPRHVATLSAMPWEGEAAEEPTFATPDPVIVGPWRKAEEEAGPDAGEADRVEEPVGFAERGEQGLEVLPCENADQPKGSPDAGDRGSLVRLRQALACADRERLRAEAGRLAPLVRRLAALRDEGSAPLR